MVAPQTPAPWLRPSLALGSAALLAALFLLRSACTPSSSEPGAVRAPEEPSRAPVETSGHPSITSAPLPASEDAGTRSALTRPSSDVPALARDGEPAPSASTPSDDAARIAAVTAATRADPATLALLSNIERELRREPPPEVHALISAQRGGAQRAELIERMQRDVPKDVILRALVLRWIDEVAPDPAARPGEQRTDPNGAPQTRPWVTPFRKKSQ